MTQFPRSTGVFVVGGGPAGLAAAIAARHHGFDVTVADPSVPPIDKACGEGIMPDGLAAARSLGIDLELSKTGGFAFRGIRFREGATSVEAAFPNGQGLGLRRTELHRLMVDRAEEAGVRLFWGARVTGIEPDGVEIDGRVVRARWIIGADGGQSRVRRWAGLDACVREGTRYGFRRHYPIAPWSPYMEIHWADGCQLYITPVSANEICVVVISRDPRRRLDDALPRFPEVRARVHSKGIFEAAVDRGGISATRRLESVTRGRVALIGDASGSVDAITGEGLCLLFQQAVALGDAMAAGDLRLYEREHRRFGRRPEMMSNLMLLMTDHGRLRRRALRAMASDPRLFTRMLALHVGELSTLDLLTNGVALGRQMLTV